METNSPVMSITDEQIAEIIDFSDSDCAADWEEVRGLKVGPLRALISRLRAAERDAARWQLRAETLRQLYSSSLSDEELDTAIDTAMKGEQQ